MNNLIEYDVNEAYIAKETDIYKDIRLIPDDKDSYAIVMSGLKAHREIRLSIEEKRKSNNSGANKYIKDNNKRAKELHALNDPGEQRLKDIRQVEDDRIAEIKAEEARIERKRVDDILTDVQKIKDFALDATFLATTGLQARLKDLVMVPINEKIYMEFLGKAEVAYTETLMVVEEALANRVRLDKKDAARKLEAERLEEIRFKQEEAQKKIDAENARQAEEKAKQDAKAQEERDRIAEAQRKIDEEKAHLKAEKKAEQERKDREEFEKQAKEEARIQAERDAIAHLEKLEVDRIAREKTEKREAERQEDLKPDKQKIEEWVSSFNDVNNPTPKIADVKISAIFKTALNALEILLQNVLEDVEAV